MSPTKTFITPEGLQKLNEELHYLKSVRRKEIAQRIKEAQELGDISENAEYTEAKEEQMILDGKIMDLEETLRNIALIDKAEKTDTVELGSTITIKDSEGKKLQYTLVGPNESDPVNGLISNESPTGKAFLGKKIGDTVQVNAPKGTIIFEIAGIS